MDAKLHRDLQAERIDGRKDWVRYVELKTAIYREHVAHVEAELAPIEHAVRRHAGHRAGDAEASGASRD